MKKFFIISLLTSLAALFACSSDSTKSNKPPTTTTAQQNPGDTNQAGVNTDPTTGDNTDTTNDDTGSVSDAGGNDVAPKEPTNQAECLTACEAKYPTAAADSHQLDNTCFFGAACGAVCDNLGSGENHTPSADAGAMCDTAKAGSYPIAVPGGDRAQGCADCLASTPTCCTLWIKIFSSAEGQQLNSCANACWSKFKQ